MHHSGEDRVSIANSFRTVLNAYDPVKGIVNTDIAAIRDTRAGYVTNVDSRWVEDGSFIRGKNLLLSYTFTPSHDSKVEASEIEDICFGAELLPENKYRGNDPEVTTYGNAFAQGQTFFDYPKPTTYMLGVKCSILKIYYHLKKFDMKFKLNR